MTSEIQADAGASRGRHRPRAAPAGAVPAAARPDRRRASSSSSPSTSSARCMAFHHGGHPLPHVQPRPRAQGAPSSSPDACATTFDAGPPRSRSRRLRDAKPRVAIRSSRRLTICPPRSGRSGSPVTTRVNWPRCSSSRPLPPRPVTSYFAVLTVCSAPRLVSTSSRSRSPRRGDEAEHAILLRIDLDQDHAAARARTGSSPRRPRRASRAPRASPQSASRRRSMRATPTTSAPSAGLRVAPAGARARLDEAARG